MTRLDQQSTAAAAEGKKTATTRNLIFTSDFLRNGRPVECTSTKISNYESILVSPFILREQRKKALPLSSSHSFVSIYHSLCGIWRKKKKTFVLFQIMFSSSMRTHSILPYHIYATHQLVSVSREESFYFIFFFYFASSFEGGVFRSPLTTAHSHT